MALSILLLSSQSIALAWSFCYINSFWVAFCFADLCMWAIKLAFWDISLFTRATSLQYPICVSHFHLIKSRLLFPGWAERSLQLVDVLCAQFLCVSSSKRGTGPGHCFHLSRHLLEHLNIVERTCKVSSHLIVIWGKKNKK